MQEYRSGHNEAVLKTVRPKATGVRIPLPAPKKKIHPLGGSFFFGTALKRDSNAVKKQHGVLFLNGDRRIFQNITNKPKGMF